MTMRYLTSTPELKLESDKHLIEWLRLGFEPRSVAIVYRPDPNDSKKTMERTEILMHKINNGDVIFNGMEDEQVVKKWKPILMNLAKKSGLMITSGHPRYKEWIDQAHRLWDEMHEHAVILYPKWMNEKGQPKAAKKMYRWFEKLPDRISCPVCQKHYQQWWKKHPLMPYLLTGRLDEWVNNLHNSVNRLNQKREWTLEESNQRVLSSL
jgi:hypothetical protein